MPLDQSFTFIYSDFLTSILPLSIQLLVTLAPVLFAIIMGMIWWDLWVDYVQGKQFLGLKYTVLELKLPKETFKSPAAMEVVLTALHNTADGSFYARYWKGETRPWYSLELVSIEGTVKYFIWTEDRRKVNLMSAMYSQFPGIEIQEVEDYAKSVHYDPKVLKIWAAEFAFTKKPPNDLSPIKTYVDYGLEKDPKEEFKVDPMLPLLEFLGSVGPNQQVWMQIPIIAHKGEVREPGHLFKRYDPWLKGMDKLKNEIMNRDPKTKSPHVDPVSGWSKLPMLSKGEQEAVWALERRGGKYAFDCGIRMAYIAKREIFNTPFGIGGCVGSMKQFGAEGFNGFKPNGKRWIVQFDYPWQDFRDMRRNRQSRLFLAAYKRRSFFYGPFRSPRLTLNTEELATIYHFPGSVAATPTLDRVPSKKAQAPGNLPT
jgi:hypothetical protein